MSSPSPATYVEALVDGDKILCTCVRPDGTHTPVGSLAGGHTSVQCRNCRAQVCLDVRIYKHRLLDRAMSEFSAGQERFQMLIAAIAAA